MSPGVSECKLCHCQSWDVLSFEQIRIHPPALNILLSHVHVQLSKHDMGYGHPTIIMDPLYHLQLVYQPHIKGERPSAIRKDPWSLTKTIPLFCVPFYHHKHPNKSHEITMFSMVFSANPMKSQEKSLLHPGFLRKSTQSGACFTSCRPLLLLGETFGEIRGQLALCWAWLLGDWMGGFQWFLPIWIE